MAQNDDTAIFSGLVDLASERLGGQALGTNDDFFAGCENLIKPGRAIFIADKYTERGKWMDGWESRRKRGPGHDWCVLKLGLPGVIRGVDLDTQHFLGNHAPYAAIEATVAPPDATLAHLADATWTEILPQSPLGAGCQNLFTVGSDATWTHIRLNIYPDGGVARCRVYGEVRPTWDLTDDDRDATLAGHVQDGEVDLAALRNGARVLVCSDMFFSPMNQLIFPGRSDNMSGGWESRRRRGPGEDWAIVQLGAEGTVRLVEVDTNHFKGNFPDRFRLEGLRAPGARITDLLEPGLAWHSLLGETTLSGHNRHFFRDQVTPGGPFTHARLTIIPDGGVSRLRLYGCRS